MVSSPLHDTRTVNLWRLCSVSVISANKLCLQALHQLIGIKLLTSDSVDIFGS